MVLFLPRIEFWNRILSTPNSITQNIFYFYTEKWTRKKLWLLDLKLKIKVKQVGIAYEENVYNCCRWKINEKQIVGFGHRIAVTLMEEINRSNLRKEGVESEWRAYHEIDTFVAVMPGRISLNNNERDMDSVTLVLDIMWETLVPVYHKSDTLWPFQVPQRPNYNKHQNMPQWQPHLHQSPKSMKL